MKTLCLLIAFILLSCAVLHAQNQKLEVGIRFQMDKLSFEKKAGLTTLVAFVPSLQYENEYASMMTQGFYYYFDQRLAFGHAGFMYNPETEIVYVVRDKQDDARSIPNIMGSAKAIYDEKGELFAYFGVKQSPHKNFDSTVILVDRNGAIAYVDDGYRSQGEHLKPLENKLKDLYGVLRKIPGSNANKALKIGDQAPDLWISDKERLSDLRGYVVLLSFYPAAFSGVFPGRDPSNEEVSVATVNLRSLRVSDLETMTCIRQITSLDKHGYFSADRTLRKPKNEARRIAISSSTPALLMSWKGLLGTNNIEYANDPDYSASVSYSAYNPLGYNNRVSVIVDRKGKVAFIDTDYSFADEEVLNRKLEELLKKEK